MGEYINSKQARFDKSHVSCGVTEVHHLPSDTPGNVVFSIATNLFHKANGRPSAFVLFSDVVDKEEISRGQRLAEEIKKMNMGPLVESSKRVNPRSGNTIRVWLWEFDADKFRAWYVEEHANRVSD
jgi:hypothetical protein